MRGIVKLGILSLFQWLYAYLSGQALFSLNFPLLFYSATLFILTFLGQEHIEKIGACRGAEV